MRVAVDFRLSSDDSFFKSLLRAFAGSQEQHQLMIVYGNSSPDIGLASNINVETVQSKASGVQLRIPDVIKKWKPDLIVSDRLFLLQRALPQLLVINDFSWQYRKNNRVAKAFVKTIVATQSKKATGIVVFSDSLRSDLLKISPSVQHKTAVVPPFIDNDSLPLDWDDRESAKASYADGREYFLFCGGFDPLKNLITALKAFSRFKKWHQSDMKLVVCGDTADTLMQEKIRTYKYREDVVLLQPLPPMREAKLIGGAYALVAPAIYEPTGYIILKSMACGTPVVSSTAGAAKEVAGDAVLYADAGNEDDVAAQMMRLYKDEDLRSRLIASGLNRAASFPATTAVAAFDEAIRQAASRPGIK